MGECSVIISALRRGMSGHASSTEATGPTKEPPIDADGWDASHQASKRALPAVLAILQHNSALSGTPEMGGAR